MWFLFHHKSGAHTVPGGETFVEHCPTCQRETKFEEVEVGEKLGVFFIDVVSDKERAFRCRVCGDVFDLRDKPAAAPAPKPAARTAAQLTEERREREAETAAKAVRIEDELAELKRRMGK